MRRTVYEEIATEVTTRPVRKARVANHYDDIHPVTIRERDHERTRRMIDTIPDQKIEGKRCITDKGMTKLETSMQDMVEFAEIMLFLRYCRARFILECAKDSTVEFLENCPGLRKRDKSKVSEFNNR